MALWATVACKSLVYECIIILLQVPARYFSCSNDPPCPFILSSSLTCELYRTCYSSMEPPQFHSATSSNSSCGPTTISISLPLYHSCLTIYHRYYTLKRQNLQATMSSDSLPPALEDVTIKGHIQTVQSGGSVPWLPVNSKRLYTNAFIVQDGKVG